MPAREIAVIIGDLGQGGTERQLYFFLSHCDRSRWHPVLYVSGQCGYWNERISALGVPIVMLCGSRLAKLRQFRTAVIEQGATCFFSWTSYTNGFGLALLGRPSRRIGSFRNAQFADLPSQLGRLWRWISLHAVSLAVCNSPETQQLIASRLHPRSSTVSYVPNAVEVFPPERIEAHRREWRRELNLRDGDLLVVGVGRLTRQKRFCRFVDAIALARREQPIQAVIAGLDRGCGPALEQRIRCLGLAQNIRLIGPVPDARELICAADILLLSSDHEGMPNVVLEAMAAGIPCVSTPVNAVSTLFCDGQTGIVAQPDPSDLAAHLVSLAADPDRRRAIGGRARAMIERDFRPELITSKLWALCDGGTVAA